MKEIIREYGTGIIAVLAALGLFGTIFFGLDIHGKYQVLANAQTKKSAFEEKRGTYDVSTRVIPQIMVAYVPEKGGKYASNELFVSSPEKQRFLSVRVMEIWRVDDISGEYTDNYEIYDSKSNTITPENTGTYRAKVSVVDSKGTSNTQWVYFVVEV